mmetsp:Transcript_23482/g.59371  ORF Transcript_23482/g.59371 Transcript_23482/m.59371 type:complete len:375 (-) Transcript_23482:1678-2802(-)
MLRHVRQPGGVGRGRGREFVVLNRRRHEFEFARRPGRRERQPGRHNDRRKRIVGSVGLGVDGGTWFAAGGRQQQFDRWKGEPESHLSRAGSAEHRGDGEARRSNSGAGRRRRRNKSSRGPGERTNKTETEHLILQTLRPALQHIRENNVRRDEPELGHLDTAGRSRGVPRLHGGARVFFDAPSGQLPDHAGDARAAVAIPTSPPRAADTDRGLHESKAAHELEHHPGKLPQQILRAPGVPPHRPVQFRHEQRAAGSAAAVRARRLGFHFAEPGLRVDLPLVQLHTRTRVRQVHPITRGVHLWAVSRATKESAAEHRECGRGSEERRVLNIDRKDAGRRNQARRRREKRGSKRRRLRVPRPHGGALGADHGRDCS